MVSVKIMDGLLIINKPLGFSSHHVVNIVRKKLNTKKVGHSGTLDVEASGVLVLGINKGTKLMNYLNQDEKIYEFRVALGTTTKTLDHTSEIITSKHDFSIDQFDEISAKLIGEHDQVPPDYAAIKVEGKKLYQYARNNQEMPKMNARKTWIYDFKRVSDFVKTPYGIEVTCFIHVSKGFYVRAFARDLAEMLHTVGHTRNIHRIKAGDFDISHAVSLEDDLSKALIPLSQCLPNIESYRCSAEEVIRISHGKVLYLEHHAPMIKCLDENHQLLAIYEKHQDYYKAKNVFM